MKASTLALVAFKVETLASGYNIVSITDNAIDGITLELERWDGAHYFSVSFDVESELDAALKANVAETVAV